MSLVSAVTGSDSVTLTVSGSGFNFSGSSANPDTNFNGRIFSVSFRSVDQPWINYGVPLDAGLVLGPNNTGFNSNIYIPRGMIPSGQYDLMVFLPNVAMPLTLRVNVSGSTATRAVTNAAPPITAQYQDVVPSFPYWQAITPGGTNNPAVMTGLTGTPEFGAGSGSIAG